MSISGGSYAIWCKMLMDTFTGTTLQWFTGIPDGHITSFPQFSKLFIEQFPTNKVKPLKLYDLFNVKKKEGEELKDYLNRFCVIRVRLQTHDEEMMVAAFVQGMTTEPFSDSLIRNPTKTFSEVRERAIAHIEAKETILRKNGSSRSKQPKPKESNWDWSLRENDTSTKKRTDSRYVPYVAKRDQPKTKAREGLATKPKFWVSYKELLSIPGVADKLRFPHKTDRSLGSWRDAWCEFH